MSRWLVFIFALLSIQYSVASHSTVILELENDEYGHAEIVYDYYENDKVRSFSLKVTKSSGNELELDLAGDEVQLVEEYLGREIERQERIKSQLSWGQMGSLAVMAGSAACAEFMTGTILGVKLGLVCGVVALVSGVGTKAFQAIVGNRMVRIEQLNYVSDQHRQRPNCHGELERIVQPVERAGLNMLSEMVQTLKEIKDNYTTTCTNQSDVCFDNLFAI